MAEYNVYELFNMEDFKNFNILSQVNELEGVSFEAVFNTVGGFMFRVFDDELENQNFIVGTRREGFPVKRGRYLFFYYGKMLYFGIKQD
jgi:hypothetical protein